MDFVQFVGKETAVGLLLVVICGIGVVLWCVAAHNRMMIVQCYGVMACVGLEAVCFVHRGAVCVVSFKCSVVGIKKSQLVQTRGRFVN